MLEEGLIAVATSSDPPPGCISLLDLAARRQVSRTDIVMRVLSGDLPAWLRPGSGRLMSRIVVKVGTALDRASAPTTVSVREAAVSLGVTVRMVPVLVQAGCLDTCGKYAADGELKKRTVSANSIENFAEKFVFTRAASKQLRTSIRKAIALMLVAGFAPVVPHDSKRGVSAVWLAGDVDRLVRNFRRIEGGANHVSEEEQRVETCPWVSDRPIKPLRASKPYLSIFAAAKEYGVTSFWIQDWIARGGLSLHAWQEGRESKSLLAREELESLFRKLRDENSTVTSAIGNPFTANPQMVSNVKGWLSVAEAARILAVNWTMTNSLIDAGVVKAERTSGLTSVDPSSLHDLVEKIERMAGEYSSGNMSLWNTGQVIGLNTRAEYKTKFAAHVQAVAAGEIGCLRYKNRPSRAGIAIYRADVEALGETVRPKGAVLSTVEVCVELRCRAPDVRELVATGFLKEVGAVTTDKQIQPKERRHLRISRASVNEFQSTWVFGSSMSEGPPSRDYYEKLIQRFGKPTYLGK